MFPQSNDQFLAHYGVNLESRTIYIRGEIGERNSSHVIKWLAEFERKSLEPITIMINSEGGDVVEGLAIVDAIELCHAPVVGIATGSCMSMATYILAVCDKRKATRYTSFLIHNGTQTLEGTPEDNQALMKHFASVDKVCLSIYARVMKKTVKQIAKMFTGNTFFMADEALRLGLIEEICERVA